MIRYVELKTDQSNRGPAWVARVQRSKSGRTVYFNGKALKRGKGVSSNHYDLATGEEYWVSGVKKQGGDRHWAGGGIILIEASAVAEYLAETGQPELDTAVFRVIPDLPATGPAQFAEQEHRPYEAG